MHQRPLYLQISALCIHPSGLFPFVVVLMAFLSHLPDNTQNLYEHSYCSRICRRPGFPGSSPGFPLAAQETTQGRGQRMLTSKVSRISLEAPYSPSPVLPKSKIQSSQFLLLRGCFLYMLFHPPNLAPVFCHMVKGSCQQSQVCLQVNNESS